MADVELLPSSVAAFVEALKGERGSLDAWLEVNDEREVAAHVEAYARANIAPLQAENERLRAEVERLRRLVQERDAMLGRRLCSGTNADGKPRCLVLAEERARADRLTEALRDAEKSLRTIADLAGGTEYLMTIGDVRGYANSRANAARAALAQEDRND